MAFFEKWSPDKEAWRPIDDWAAYCPSADVSHPLLLPNTGDDAATLGKFGAMPTSTTADGAAIDTSDVLLHAGGPVWALDWCPAPALPCRPDAAASSITDPGVHAVHLAIGSHPPEQPLHQVGVPLSAPNCIQLWEVPTPQGAPSDLAQPLPRMALAVGHDGGVTWHCTWCPAPEACCQEETAAAAAAAAPPGALPRMGLLAGVLGDGTLRIWAVPKPTSLAAGESPLPPGAFHVATPSPVASLTPRHLTGSLPCRVDWLPVAPYDLLLVGCWDGTVAVLKLNPDVTGEQGRPLGLRLLCHFPADVQPLRAAYWLPPRPQTIDLAHRSMFITAGHEGTVKVWDCRDPFWPAFHHQMSSCTILDVAVSTTPFGVMAAMEDASIKGLLLDSRAVREQITASSKPPATYSFRGNNQGAIWSVSAHPKGSHVAYGGEDGVVAVGGVDLYWDNRKRSDHVPLWAMHAEEGVALRVLTGPQLAARGDNAGVYVKAERVMERNEKLAGVVLDGLQALHKVAWGPGVASEGSTWLAAGGAAGIVRCSRETLTGFR